MAFWVAGGFVRIADMNESDMNIDTCAGAGAQAHANSAASLEADARAESRTNASDAESLAATYLERNLQLRDTLGIEHGESLSLTIWAWASTI